MSWFPDYLNFRHSELSDAAALAAGRALHICQHFESASKFVLLMADACDYISHNKDATLEETFDNCKDKWLAQTIKSLCSHINIKENIIKDLENAVNARNYIAHKGTSFFHSQNKWLIIAALKKLRSEFQRMIRGANQVFLWSYEIKEKEPGPRGFFNDYPKMVDEWVFGHIKSLLEESENHPELVKAEASLKESFSK